MIPLLSRWTAIRERVDEEELLDLNEGSLDEVAQSLGDSSCARAGERCFSAMWFWATPATDTTPDGRITAWTRTSASFNISETYTYA